MFQLNRAFVVAVSTLVVVAQMGPTHAINNSTRGDSTLFGESIQNANASQTCKEAVNSLDSVSPNLKSCYRNSGLFFSVPEVVCSPNCLEPTIAASKKLDQACPVSDDENSLSSPKSVYKKWSCENTVKAACAKDKKGAYCIRSLASKMVIAGEIKLNTTNLTATELRNKLDCNDTCAKSLYEALDGNGDKAPVLYYFGYSSFNTIFSAYEKFCGFQNSTAKAAAGGASNNDTVTSTPINDTVTSTPIISKTNNTVNSTVSGNDTVSNEDAAKTPVPTAAYV